MLLKALGLSGSIWLIALEDLLNAFSESFSEYWRRGQKNSITTSQLEEAE
jgi:hypothetical protein